MTRAKAKNPNIAFALGLLLPGGGFMYLGRWKWAFGFLAFALAVGIVLAFLDLPEALSRGASIGIAVSSAMGARAEAQRILREQTTAL